MTTYSITGSINDLSDLIGASSAATGARASVTIQATTTSGAVVDGSSSYIGREVTIDIPDDGVMPTVTVTSGVWLFIFVSTERIHGRPRFEATQIKAQVTANTTWSAIITQGTTEITFTPTTLQQALAAQAAAAASATAAAGSATGAAGSATTATSAATAAGNSAASAAASATAAGLPTKTRNTAPVPISGRSSWPNAISDGTNTYNRTLSLHSVASECWDPVVVYTNAIGDEATTTAPNDIVVQAAIEYPTGSGTWFPLYDTNGKSSVTINPGGVLQLAPAGLYLPAGDTFHVMTLVTVTSGGKWPTFPTGAMVYTSTLNEAVVEGTGTPPALTSAITNDATKFSFRPVTVLARRSRTASTSPIVGLVSDSIGTGTGDDGGGVAYPVYGKGWFERAFGGQRARINLAIGGSKLSTWRVGNRRAKSPLLSLCDHLIFNLGVNDISGGPTLLSIQQDWITLAQEFANRGLILHAGTVTPHTSATDGSSGPINETLRQSWNGWLRDGAPLAGGWPMAVGNSTGLLNMLTANQASLETDTVGWVSVSGNTTIARSTAYAASGSASLEMTATASGSIEASTRTGLNGFAVVVGNTYTARGEVRAGATGRVVTPRLAFYDSAGTAIGTATNGTTFNDTTTGFTVGSVTAVAPTGAVYGAVRFFVTGCSAGEKHYVDKISVALGTTTTWAAGGAQVAPTVRIGDAAHPVAYLLEMADAVESARNSGLWKTGYTLDGLHPTYAGHVDMAAVATAAMATFL